MLLRCISSKRCTACSETWRHKCGAKKRELSAPHTIRAYLYSSTSQLQLSSSLIVADPLSVSTSIVGVLGFAAQVIKLIDTYRGSFKSAHLGAQALCTEVSAIESVLQRLTDFLNTTVDEVAVTFVEGCVLRTAVDECGEIIKRLYMLFSRLAKSLKEGSGAKGVVVVFVEKLKWPSKKETCRR
jgi:hypothetical protein